MTDAADRALRALADSVGRSRTADDLTDPGIPVAATVVIARDGADGPEVLLIERPDRGSFAGAWVFPGGKLDPGDRHDDDEPEEAAARRAGVRETREETGLRLAPTALVTMSVWDPPPGIALRIRTWFFATRAPEGELALSAHEAVAAEWVRPGDLLARHALGELTLYPPTWVTLHGLADQPDVDALLAQVRFAGLRRFETVARRGATGPVLLWDGDAEYETDAATAASAPSADEGSASRSTVLLADDAESARRHRLEVGGLPWVYTRRD